jgi:pantoate ligase / CMP/dCMP kinase
MIIAIDGPAGAGKSTVTKLVAARLGFTFLDTGAMYRAVTWLALDRQIALDDEAKIADLVNGATIELDGDRVLIDARDVSDIIRTPAVTAGVSTIAALGVVRTALVAQQQAIGKNGNIVAEGRDMCTHVFPHAEVKIFLTATIGERARRRQQDLTCRHQPPVELAELERSIAERDRLDSTREIAPLRQAPDAIELVTDGMSIDGVVDRIVEIYRSTHE